jgi:hypothetical protein
MIDAGGGTMTVAVESGNPGARTWTTAEPTPMLMTRRPIDVVFSFINTPEGTFATAGLLENTVKLMPPEGAGDDRVIVSIAWVPTRFKGFGLSVIADPPAVIVTVAGALPV